MAVPPQRRSFREIEREHYKHVKDGLQGPTELDNIITAFRHICVHTHPDDENSFFTIGGYHGEPFRGAGWGSTTWWGGYCYHGQILFPTWHRAYCLRLEQALRRAPGCGKLTLPFIDWCDDETRATGLPDTFHQKKYQYSDASREPVDNPLFSYKFQKSVFDNVPANFEEQIYDYTKLKDYATVRYPYSGLVGGSQEQKNVTAKWNEQFSEDKAKELLNENIKSWLADGESLDSTDEVYQGVYDKFRNCLDAPNFTVFSNTTSAQQYNQEKLNKEINPGLPRPEKPDELEISLENPHNAMHLATGGFTSPVQPTDKTVTGANGDMGENNTAGLDPIFFFHHCYIDRMFWLWQKRHNQTTKLIIEPELADYPGTNNMDGGQGPVAGASIGDQLTLTTPLTPFKHQEDRYMTSLDVVDIKKLGYEYGPGSFDKLAEPEKSIPVRLGPHSPKVHLAISGISRANFPGSFVIQTRYKQKLVAAEAILSRNNVEGCANCQAHLNVKTFAPLLNVTSKNYDHGQIEVTVHTHGNRGSKGIPDAAFNHIITPIYHGE